MFTVSRNGASWKRTAQTSSCAALMASWQAHMVRLVLKALASCKAGVRVRQDLALEHCVAVSARLFGREVVVRALGAEADVHAVHRDTALVKLAWCGKQA